MFLDVECQTTFAKLSLDLGDYSEFKTEDPHSIELCTQEDNDINVDFPSLKAAASHHEKKHFSCPAAQARKFRECRRHTSDTVGSQHTSTEDQSQLGAAGYSLEATMSIPACNAFAAECGPSALPMQNGTGVWRELPRKSSLDDVAVPHRRRVSGDRELERPVIGIGSSHSTKPPLSFGEFLPSNQISDSSDDQPSGFSPMFHCTKCGDPAHRYNECSRTLGEAFCD